jgi:hypothetical protein
MRNALSCSDKVAIDVLIGGKVKKTFLAAIAMLISAPAFATHSYRSEQCVSTLGDYQLVYKGNYPVGGPFGLSKRGSSDDIELFAEGDASEENLLEVVHGKVVAYGQTFPTCQGDLDEGIDFKHVEWTSQKVYKFTQLSAEAEQKTGIKSGTYMIFNCKESSDTPMKCN